MLKIYKVFLILSLLSLINFPLLSQQWISVYNGPSGSIDSVRNLVVDNSGNVYVTGSSISSNVYDYTTLKYNNAGVLLWEARYDYSAHNIDDAQWIAIDYAGNSYVTGFSRSGTTSGTADFATVKYNASGIEQWSVRYNGPAGNADHSVKVAVDNSGNVYVTGWSMGEGASIDYATIKYNSAGVQQWVSRYNGPGNSLDAPTALSIDNSGNVYVTGWSRSASITGSEDYLTIKYDQFGAQQWVKRYNGPANWTDIASSMTLDNSGNIIVTGHAYATETLSDYHTIKYNAAGILQWTAVYNNISFNGSDLAKMVITDNNGNVYVTGSSNTEYPLGYPNYVTIKYNSSGIQQWVVPYNGPGNGPDEPASIALDIAGNVWVTGKATMPGFFYDFATLKYNSDGQLLSEMLFNGASNSQDGATWIAKDNNGNMYVAGNSMYHTNYASDFAVIKYSADPSGLINDPLSNPETFSLEQNYPNPFNASTKISFNLPDGRNGRIIVFDLLGREMMSREIYSYQDNITLDLTSEQINSGVYFYKLEADNYRSEVKKLILLK